MPKIKVTQQHCKNKDIDLDIDPISFNNIPIGKITAKQHDAKFDPKQQYRLLRGFNQLTTGKVYILQLCSDKPNQTFNLKSFAPKHHKLEQVIIDGDIPPFCSLIAPLDTPILIEGSVRDGVRIISDRQNVTVTGSVGKNIEMQPPGKLHVLNALAQRPGGSYFTQDSGAATDTATPMETDEADGLAETTAETKNLAERNNTDAAKDSRGARGSKDSLGLSKSSGISDHQAKPHRLEQARSSLIDLALGHTIGRENNSLSVSREDDTPMLSVDSNSYHSSNLSNPIPQLFIPIPKLSWSAAELTIPQPESAHSNHKSTDKSPERPMVLQKPLDKILGASIPVQKMTDKSHASTKPVHKPNDKISKPPISIPKPSNSSHSSRHVARHSVRPSNPSHKPSNPIVNASKSVPKPPLVVPAQAAAPIPAPFVMPIPTYSVPEYEINRDKGELGKVAGFSIFEALDKRSSSSSNSNSNSSASKKRYLVLTEINVKEISEQQARTKSGALILPLPANIIARFLEETYHAYIIECSIPPNFNFSFPTITGMILNNIGEKTRIQTAKPVYVFSEQTQDIVIENILQTKQIHFIKEGQIEQSFVRYAPHQPLIPLSLQMPFMGERAHSAPTPVRFLDKRPSYRSFINPIVNPLDNPMVIPSRILTSYKSSKVKLLQSPGSLKITHKRTPQNGLTFSEQLKIDAENLLKFVNQFEEGNAAEKSSNMASLEVKLSSESKMSAEGTMNADAKLNAEASYKPLRHQLRGMRELATGWLRASQGQGKPHAVLDKATGTGKTNEIIDIFKAITLPRHERGLNKKKMMFVVPLVNLNKQTIDRFQEVAGKQLQVEALRDGSKALKARHINQVFNRSDVIVTTIQTLCSENSQGKIPFDLLDMIVIDEAHTALSIARGKFIREEIMAKYPKCIVLAATATPFLDDGERTVYELLGFKADGSDNPVKPYGIQEAIIDGTNCPVATAIVYPKNWHKIKFKRNAGKINIKDTEKKLNLAKYNKMLVSLYMNEGDAVTKRPFRGMKGIVFCAGINHAIELAKEFNRIPIDLVDPQGVLRKRYEERAWQDYIGKQKALYAVRHQGDCSGFNAEPFKAKWKEIFDTNYGPFTIAQDIHSKHTASECEKILLKSKLGGTLLLTGANKLIEGYDDPEIEFILRAAPSFSTRVVVQSCGRGLRVDKNNPNKILYVLEVAWGKTLGAKFFNEYLRDKTTWIPRFAFSSERLKNYRDTHNPSVVLSENDKIQIPDAHEVESLQWEPKRVENRSLTKCVEFIDFALVRLRQKIENCQKMDLSAGNTDLAEAVGNVTSMEIDSDTLESKQDKERGALEISATDNMSKPGDHEPANESDKSDDKGPKEQSKDSTDPGLQRMDTSDLNNSAKDQDKGPRIEFDWLSAQAASKEGNKEEEQGDNQAQDSKQAMEDDLVVDRSHSKEQERKRNNDRKPDNDSQDNSLVSYSSLTAGNKTVDNKKRKRSSQENDKPPQADDSAENSQQSKRPKTSHQSEISQQSGTSHQSESSHQSRTAQQSETSQPRRTSQGSHATNAVHDNNTRSVSPEHQKIVDIMGQTKEVMKHIKIAIDDPRSPDKKKKMELNVEMDPKRQAKIASINSLLEQLLIRYEAVNDKVDVLIAQGKSQDGVKEKERQEALDALIQETQDIEEQFKKIHQELEDLQKMPDPRYKRGKKKGKMKAKVNDQAQASHLEQVLDAQAKEWFEKNKHHTLLSILSPDTAPSVLQPTICRYAKQILWYKPECLFEKDSNTGDSPLHLALHSLMMVRLLIKHRVNVNVANKLGRTPLHSFVLSILGRKHISYGILVELLTTPGININAVDNEGNTALHLANLQYSPAMDHVILFLMAFGANKDITNKAGLSAFNMRSEQQNIAFNGSGFNIQDSLGNSLLHIVLQSGLHKCEKKLLALGMNCNLKDSLGRTPVYNLVGAEKYDANDINSILMSLLSYNLDLNVVDNNGQSPLHFALSKPNFSSRPQVVQFLLQRTNENIINIVDKNGDTCLHLFFMNIMGCLFESKKQMTFAEAKNNIFPALKAILEELIKNNLCPFRGTAKPGLVQNGDAHNADQNPENNSQEFIGLEYVSPLQLFYRNLLPLLQEKMDDLDEAMQDKTRSGREDTSLLQHDIENAQALCELLGDVIQEHYQQAKHTDTKHIQELFAIKNEIDANFKKYNDMFYLAVPANPNAALITASIMPRTASISLNASLHTSSASSSNQQPRPQVLPPSMPPFPSGTQGYPNQIHEHLMQQHQASIQMQQQAALQRQQQAQYSQMQSAHQEQQQPQMPQGYMPAQMPQGHMSTAYMSHGHMPQGYMPTAYMSHGHPQGYMSQEQIYQGQMPAPWQHAMDLVQQAELQQHQMQQAEMQHPSLPVHQHSDQMQIQNSMNFPSFLPGFSALKDHHSDFHANNFFHSSNPLPGSHSPMDLGLESSGSGSANSSTSMENQLADPELDTEMKEAADKEEAGKEAVDQETSDQETAVQEGSDDEGDEDFDEQLYYRYTLGLDEEEEEEESNELFPTRSNDVEMETEVTPGQNNLYPSDSEAEDEDEDDYEGDLEQPEEPTSPATRHNQHSAMDLGSEDGENQDENEADEVDEESELASNAENENERSTAKEEMGQQNAGFLPSYRNFTKHFDQEDVSSEDNLDEYRDSLSLTLVRNKVSDNV